MRTSANPHRMQIDSLSKEPIDFGGQIVQEKKQTDAIDAALEIFSEFNTTDYLLRCSNSFRNAISLTSCVVELV